MTKECVGRTGGRGWGGRGRERGGGDGAERGGNGADGGRERGRTGASNFFPTLPLLC